MTQDNDYLVRVPSDLRTDSGEVEILAGVGGWEWLAPDWEPGPWNPQIVRAMVERVRRTGRTVRFRHYRGRR